MKSLDILTVEEKEAVDLPRITENEESTSGKRKVYIESYGCQMNFSDSEIVASILRKDADFATTSTDDNADVVFLNTCAIRDNAEQKVRNRLKQLNNLKKKRPGMII